MSKRPKTPRLSGDLPKQGRRSKVTITFSSDPRSPEEIQEAELLRLKQARLWERPHGFSLVPNGRVVGLYFRRGDNLIEFAAELAGAPHLDIVIFDDHPKQWLNVHTFESAPVSPPDQTAIRAHLIAWLEAQGLRFSMSTKPPVDAPRR